MHAPNRNYLWTYTFVDELARCGLQSVVIAPGSRSTPLTMAFAQHPAIRVYSHIDERGAAFMALGLALASDAPAAVVCSSGTAAANFFPAIVEAHYAHVPLLILTADRPHELRDSGANQTVDQVKLYGDHVLWSVDVALPESNPPDVAIRNLRTLADRAYALADGLPKGAVHLNFPFRKPLEPIAVEGEGWEVEWMADGKRGKRGEGRKPFTRIERGEMKPSDQQMSRLTDIVRSAKRVLIVCGPKTPFPKLIVALGEIWGAVVLADVLSNVRQRLMAFGSYEWYIRQADEWGDPDLIIHFGAMPVSQALDDYLSKVKPKHRIAISYDGVWSDFNHRIDWFLHADIGTVYSSLKKFVKWYPSDENWRAQFEAAEAIVIEEDRLHLSEISSEKFFDGAVVSELMRLKSDNINIFVSNSLPVRHLDQFYPIDDVDDVQIFCNRGASGIDGTISSALGVAAAEPDKPTVLITGDLAFYHDMNALLAAKRNGIKNLVIVLLNNNGGAIFNRLPINQPQFEPYFTELFITPHGMTFEHTAAQFSWAYARADEREPFRAAFAEALASGEPTIIEVVTDAQEDARRRREIMDKVAEALRELKHRGTEDTEGQK